MANIYQLTQDFVELQRLMDAAESDADREAIANTMAGLSGEAGDLIENFVKLIKNVEADALSIEAEISRLQHRASSIKSSVTNGKGAIKAIMEAGGYRTMKTALFSITLADGSESVDIFDEAAIPDAYLVVKTETRPDKKAIKEALKDGREVPGAKVVRGEKSVRIK